MEKRKIDPEKLAELQKLIEKENGDSQETGSERHRLLNELHVENFGLGKLRTELIRLQQDIEEIRVRPYGSEEEREKKLQEKLAQIELQKKVFSEQQKKVDELKEKIEEESRTKEHL